MKILTHWNWKADPEAPLRWPDPERRLVLVEPDLWEAPSFGEDHVRAARAIAEMEAKGAIAVEPTRDPGRMARPASIPPRPGIVPALLAQTQAELDAGLADLLAVPAAHRALLLEPREAIALGVDPRSTRPHGVLGCPRCHGYCQVRATGYDQEGFPREDACPACDGSGHAIAWVIVRGGAEPMHPAWVRGIRDQCAAAGAPFAFLGWGEWFPLGNVCEHYLEVKARHGLGGGVQVQVITDRDSSWWMAHLCSALAGRLLDGREHLDSPWGVLEVSP